ncbi:MAG: hypothetical protein L0323_21425 [Planctomycetes bacterium]|nr:hypothetical protein [Planctomycetota bacterium]
MAQDRAERGSILIFLVGSVTLLAGAIVGLLTVEQGRASQARTEIERTRAFTLAESGIDEAGVLLAANAIPPSGVIDWSADLEDNDGDSRVDEGDESLTATVARWWSDGVDNDGDGETDETDEGVARVTSTVRIGVSTVTVTGWLRRLEAVIPVEVPAVVNLLDPNADVTFKGNSFDIEGGDRSPTGGWGPAPAVYGIAINGSTKQVLTQLAKNQLDNVNGVGGRPSITSWTPPSADWLQTIVDSMAVQADVNFDHYASTYTGDLGDWKTGKKLVTHSKGSLKIGGGSQGAGVLCVDGDLEISGNWHFVGAIFVTGRVTVKGGGNGQRLHGAIFIGGDFEHVFSLETLIKGGIELVYSSAAVAGLTASSSTFDVVAVTEP